MKTSATPWRANWGTNQNTLMGIMALGLSSKLWFAAIAFLFISTKDATIVAKMLTMKPMPILCSDVMPEGFLVNLRANGTKKRSYRTIPISTVRTLKIDKLAGGIWKDGDRWRSMVRACWMVKLCWCDDEVTCKIPAAQMGNIRTMDFSSSTRWTVASLQRFGGFKLVASASVTMAALSNHLQTWKQAIRYKTSHWKPQHTKI